MADRRRARNLDSRTVEWILQLLDGWTNALTWQGLVDAIHERTGVRYTRQALANHEPIALAFASRKRDLRSERKGAAKAATVDQRLEADHISRLEATVNRLQRENELLRERFVVWAYNAHIHGMDEALLNKALPTINRGATVINKDRHKAPAD